MTECKVLELLKNAPCFGHEVCVGTPCACAQSLADEAAATISRLTAERDRMKQALEDIRDHWANQYDHPRKENEMYRGPYGIGITDGHRACTIIAERGLATPAVSDAERCGAR